MGSRSGISDALAEIILIAAVIGILVGVASWVTGVWSDWSSNAAERVFIFPDSRVVLSGGVWAELHVVSDIKPSVEVYKVELQGHNGHATSVTVVKGGPVTINSGGSFTIPAGTEAWVRIDFTGLSPADVSVAFGGKVEVLVYTSTGYVYKSVVNVDYNP